jgi:hypothetical protein
MVRYGTEQFQNNKFHFRLYHSPLMPFRTNKFYSGCRRVTVAASLCVRRYGSKIINSILNSLASAATDPKVTKFIW